MSAINVIRVFLIHDEREGKGGGERQGEKHQCVACHVAPTGNLALKPGMRPDWQSNQRPFGAQPMLNPLSYISQARFADFY